MANVTFCALPFGSATTSTRSVQESRAVPASEPAVPDVQLARVGSPATRSLRRSGPMSMVIARLRSEGLEVGDEIGDLVRAEGRGLAVLIAAAARAGEATGERRGAAVVHERPPPRHARQ